MVEFRQKIYFSTVKFVQHFFLDKISITRISIHNIEWYFPLSPLSRRLLRKWFRWTKSAWRRLPKKFDIFPRAILYTCIVCRGKARSFCQVPLRWPCGYPDPGGTAQRHKAPKKYRRKHRHSIITYKFSVLNRGTLWYVDRTIDSNTRSGPLSDLEAEIKKL